MKIECSSCCENFQLSSQQENIVKKLKRDGVTFGMLECPLCGESFDFNPQNPGTTTDEERTALLRSPISGSHGFITIIHEDGDDFYGDGETGVMWRKKETLYKDIAEIIERYSHRKLFYQYKNGEWFPNESEPDDADVLISTESIEEVDFERD